MYALRRQQAPQGTWYWAVHFMRRGQRVYRRFYEPRHGGSTLARKAALAWRDEQLAKTPVLGIVEFCAQKRHNNTSGVPGVHFLTSPRQPQGIWQAKLKIGGKAHHKSFSVRLHGDRPAFEMAVAARLEMLAQAANQPYLKHPTARRKSPQVG